MIVRRLLPMNLANCSCAFVAFNSFSTPDSPIWQYGSSLAAARTIAVRHTAGRFGAQLFRIEADDYRLELMG